MEVEIGDVVMLNSGVYPMTVNDILSDTILCQWLNYRGEKSEDEFKIETLFNPKEIFTSFSYPSDVLLHTDHGYKRTLGLYALDFDEIEKPFSAMKIGNIVRFSSYYAFMTIEEIKNNHVVCIWFNKYGYMRREIFHIKTLNIYDSNSRKAISAIEDDFGWL